MINIIVAVRRSCSLSIYFVCVVNNWHSSILKLSFGFAIEHDQVLMHWGDIDIVMKKSQRTSNRSKRKKTDID